jgi:hypothetical protein
LNHSTESNTTLIVDPSSLPGRVSLHQVFSLLFLIKQLQHPFYPSTRETNQTTYINKMSDQGSPAAPAAEVKPKADGESIFT